MSNTPLVRKYIDSVDGMAHQSAIEIIINLEKKLEAVDNRNTRNYYADGYEAGYQAGMAEKKEWVGLTADEATIIWERVDESDGWELIIQVQQVLKEKNGG